MEKKDLKRVFTSLVGPMKPLRRTSPKIGRNEPCICGSGKKYKKCCMEADKARELEDGHND